MTTTPNRAELMHLAVYTRINTPEGAIGFGGLLLTLMGLVVFVGTMKDTLRGWIGPVAPWQPLIALLVGVALMIVAGALHTRRFRAAAAAAGLSRAEADALADEAEALDDE